MDRLSGLPDEVICHILSLLLPDPMAVAQTSILSRSWRFHWLCVPSIGFTNLLIPNQTCKGWRSWSILVSCFGLQQQITITNPNHNYLNIFPDTKDDDFYSWIVTHNINNLVVSLNNHLALPSCLSTSQTHLRYLCIIDWGGIPSEEDASHLYFTVLKKLQLVNLAYDSLYSLFGLILRCMISMDLITNIPSLGDLLSRCPVLEELTIRRMKTKNFGLWLHPHAPLTTLTIDIENSQLLMISIPSLRYLRLYASKIIWIHIWEQPLLIEADIDLINIKPNTIFALWLMDFLVEMYNVKSLTLSTRPLKAIPPTSGYFSYLDIMFNNLTQLNLRTDWRFITPFLENADNLRVLTIFHMEDAQYWIEPKRVPACLVSHLETVNLVDFGWCTEPEFDMIKYILKNAKVLKKMEIICTPHYQLDLNVKSEAIKRFATLEIGSTTCELINFTLDDAC